MPDSEQSAFSPSDTDDNSLFPDMFDASLSPPQRLSPDLGSSSSSSSDSDKCDERPLSNKRVSRCLFGTDLSDTTSEGLSPKRPSRRATDDRFPPSRHYSVVPFDVTPPDASLSSSSSFASTSLSTLFSPSSQGSLQLLMVEQQLSNITYVPAYATNQSRMSCFTRWQAEKMMLENLDIYLRKLEELTIVTNRSPGHGIEKVSIYIANKKPQCDDMMLSGILVFDFDLTLTIKHTIADDFCTQNLIGYQISQEERDANIKNAQDIQKILQKAEAVNIKVCVVTRNDDIKNVLAYLQTLVQGISEDAHIGDYFSIVLCSPTPMAQISGIPLAKIGMKDGELTCIEQLLAVNDDTPMLLVDDEDCNQSKKDNVLFVQVVEDGAVASSGVSATLDYISQVNIFLDKVRAATLALGPFLR